MGNTNYKIILTNGVHRDTYYKWAANKEQAIILAQADAINLGKGYQFVSIEESDIEG